MKHAVRVQARPRRSLIFLCLLAGLLDVWGPVSASASDPGGRRFDWGLFASRQEDAWGVVRTRALGPLFEHAVATNDTRLIAFRPLCSSQNEPQADQEFSELLWPIAASFRVHDRYRLRFLQTWYYNFDVHTNKPRYSLWVLPFYFQGRDAKGRVYASVFPLGGQLNEFMGRDEITYFLFPLYARSTINDLKTTSVLWPIFSRTEGAKVHRIRAFPVYGRSVRDGQFDKRFFMWPFWTWVRYERPGEAGSGYLLFPLWGHYDFENQKNWYVIPPFFRFARGQRLNVTHCPWPFLQFNSGVTEKWYVWPLWGDKQMQGVRKTFALWPFYRRYRRATAVGRTDDMMIVPFYQSGKTVREYAGTGRPDETTATYRKCWPLLSYDRTGDKSYFRLLDLWPFRRTQSVERLYTPIWTLYARRAMADNVDHEVLWGLYRQQRRGPEVFSASLFPLAEWRRDDRDAGCREWSLLKGLIGYKRMGARKQVRVLYFLRFGGEDR